MESAKNAQHLYQLYRQFFWPWFFHRMLLQSKTIFYFRVWRRSSMVPVFRVLWWLFQTIPSLGNWLDYVAPPLITGCILWKLIDMSLAGREIPCQGNRVGHAQFSHSWRLHLGVKVPLNISSFCPCFVSQQSLETLGVSSEYSNLIIFIHIQLLLCLCHLQ